MKGLQQTFQICLAGILPMNRAFGSLTLLHSIKSLHRPLKNVL